MKIGASRHHIANIICLANNASEDIIRQVDNREISFKKACRMVSDMNKAAEGQPDEPTSDKQSPDRIAELEEQVKQEYYRANIAEAKVRDLKESQWNQIYHRDGIIESLKTTVRDLRKQLTAYGDMAKEGSQV
jgi:polyhydroxyalkanoate synthesis regulator phasin